MCIGWRLRRVLTLAAAAAGFAVAASAAGAVTVHVPADQPTIQDGIAAAGDSGTIVVAPGVYAGTGNTGIDFQGRPHTLVASGGPAQTVIDCEGASRGFVFQTQEDTTTVVEGFTVRNGVATLGGGIYCSSSGPKLVDCVIELCTGDDGGGLYANSTAQPVLVSCTFSSNTADDGGAVYTTAYGGRYEDCAFEGNTAENGGAVWVGFYADTFFERCSFSGNAAEKGAGLFAVDPNGHLTDSTFWDNAADLGAAVFVQSGLLPVTGCTFARNDGGTVYCLLGEATIERSIIAFDASGPPLTCAHPSFTPTTTHCFVFGNAGGDSLCGDFSDNRFEDPRFCALEAGDLELCSNSDCLPGGNSWGQVGAHASGCGPCDSPVHRSTWGRVKALYRE